MKRRSVLVNHEKAERHEAGYLFAAGAVVLVCGLAVLFMPAFSWRPAVVFGVCWLFMLAMGLCFLRVLFYSRGFADFVMGVCSALFYGALSWALNPARPADIETYREALWALLFFAGISKLVAFAQLLGNTTLPFLPVSAATDVTASVLLVLALPNYDAFYLYFYTGFAVVAAGLELLSEGTKARGFLRHLRRRAVKKGAARL